jgi:peptidoglycan hydrolase-like protein with peptidoglycan-binding domain
LSHTRAVSIRRRSIAIVLISGACALLAPAAASADTSGTGATGGSSSSSSAATKVAPLRIGNQFLQEGMKGPQVAVLQRDLTAVRFPIQSSGVFGSRTKLVVERFQSRHALAADGVVGPQTAQKLNSMIKVKTVKRSSKPKSTTTSPPVPVDTTGGTSTVPPPADAPVEPATLNSDGLAVAPSDAPEVIKKVIAAANAIAFKPYIYGGGHGSFQSAGYDCSGSVSYALHGGGLLTSPMDSTGFESYGAAGAGRWITIWTNAGHAYMQVAGLWFDTAAQSSSNGNDRWSAARISPADGFMERHPVGW